MQYLVFDFLAISSVAQITPHTRDMLCVFEYYSDTELKGHDNLISLVVTAVTLSVKEL